MNELYTSWEVAKILVCMFGDRPCNFNNMDEKADDWRSENCDICTPTECWQHAVERKWYEVE